VSEASESPPDAASQDPSVRAGFTGLPGWLRIGIVAAIFLVGPQTRVMSVLIYDMSEEGNFELVSALGGVILIATSLFVWLGFKLVGRDFMLRGR